LRGVVLLLAAGEGSRLGSAEPKAFVDVAGVPMLRRSTDAACGAKLVDSLVVAVPVGCEDRARALLDGCGRDFVVVAGGATRQASAWNALEAAPSCDAILVHDAARALCPSFVFDSCLELLDQHEALCAAVPVWDTLKEVSDASIVRTVDRANLVAAQTPQAFPTALYRRAHEEAKRDGVEATDDAALVERLGVTVTVTLGSPHNIKITSKLDLKLAEALLA
jgi:2-C-methyl-D-erythritol 4-phosphate cytidylyltransferase